MESCISNRRQFPKHAPVDPVALLHLHTDLDIIFPCSNPLHCSTPILMGINPQEYNPPPTILKSTPCGSNPLCPERIHSYHEIEANSTPHHQHRDSKPISTGNHPLQSDRVTLKKRREEQYQKTENYSAPVLCWRWWRRHLRWRWRRREGSG